MDRYIRQTKFFGEKSQKELSSSTAVLIGCGGLGSLISQSLVRAGIGELRIVDKDNVEIINLHRQFLYNEEDVGKPKVNATAEKLRKINSKVKITPFNSRLSSSNYKKIISGADLIIDATDNIPSRYLINEISLKEKIPWIYSSCVQNRGMVAFFSSKSPCFSCIFPHIPEKIPGCPELGILNQAVMISAAISSHEAQLFLATGKSYLENKLLHYSLKDYSLNVVRIKSRKNCGACK